jgi:CHAT domain-containing protein
LTDKAEALKQIYTQKSNDTTHLLLALQCYDTAFKAIETLRKEYFFEEANLYLSDYSFTFFEKAIQTCVMLQEATGRFNYYGKKAFEFSESAKAITLKRTIQEKTAKVGLSKNVLEKDSILKSRLTILMQSRGNTATLTAIEDSILFVKQQLEKFTRQLQQDYPEYYRLKYDFQPASHSDIQTKLLDENTVLLEYFVGDSNIYIFQITSKSFELHSIKKPTDLESKVRQFRRGLTDNGLRVDSAKEAFRLFTDNAYELYELLIAPALLLLPVTPGMKSELHESEIIKSEFSNLIIIPDGILGFIPFEILISLPVGNSSTDYRSLPYLIKKYSVRYGYSAKLLTESLGKTQNTHDDLIAFAPGFEAGQAESPENRDSVSRDMVRAGLYELTHASQEVEAISKQFRHSNYFLDTEATEAEFKRSAPGHSVIHLATHALLHDEDPAFSRLLFSSKTDLVEDGNLHVNELYNMKLNANLVVLSACNTGYGKMQRGEGIMSLARGFAYAGCPNIVMSLWPANDRSTSQIMEQFYENLSEDAGKDEALRQAKLYYLSQSDKIKSHPYFWAGFVLLGDSEPMSFAASSGLGATRIFVLIIILISVLFCVVIITSKAVFSK